MDCTQTQELLSQWIDGELHPAVEPELFGHLSRCETCRAFFRNLYTLNQEFASARALQVPASLDQRVLAADLPTVKQSRKSPWQGMRHTYSIRVLGLAIVLSISTTVLVSSYWYRHSQPQQTIVCLTPLPEVEVTGYVVVASSTTKGINQ
jgi:predicted anti-sigma-YlaC factor YlaD